MSAISTKSPQTLLVFAEQQMNAGQFQAALTTLESIATATFNTNLTAGREFLRGRCLLELKEPAQALPLLARAVAGQKSNADFRIAYGAALHQTGDLPNAEKQYREAMRLVPTAENPPFNLARILVAKGDLEGAVRAYQLTIGRNPKFVLAHAALGDIYVLLGDFAKAQASLDKALQLDINCALAWNGKGKLAERAGAFVEAADFFSKAINADPEFAEVYFNAGRIDANLGKTDDAKRHFEKALALEPDNEKFRFLSNVFFSQDHALTKDGEARVPDAFVRELFDQYATTFDKNLLSDLKYQTPTALRAALDPWFIAKPVPLKSLRAIDLGAGTGLMGSLLADHCRELIGVDLSPKMLEKAGGRGYTKLVASEIGAFLRDSTNASADLIVSSDVFIYFGDLASTFNETARVLNSGGMFAFSLESLDSIEALSDSTTAHFMLMSSGRYAHRDSYIQELLLAAGFNLSSHQKSTIRTEAGRDVVGIIYCAIKNI